MSDTQKYILLLRICVHISMSFVIFICFGFFCELLYVKYSMNVMFSNILLSLKYYARENMIYFFYDSSCTFKSFQYLLFDSLGIRKIDLENTTIVFQCTVYSNNLTISTLFEVEHHHSKC